ncbi:RB-associated KRAB zinc finger protein [Dendroctonus ponderosae]|uniref:RB-associated KRAB zinc finger protein n=1 Tax=Dendroctonus ponderosae TaxID=77166 RepID=UPI002034EDF1|nr:RB-associated KRAB zinc finger protein [Dendroctonus ponderosae]KAH1008466.1 hypothetical protein HUJ05_009019 [Dendroctonus ponderosae]
MCRARSLLLLEYRVDASFRVDFYDFFYFLLLACPTIRPPHEWRETYHCDTCFKSYKNKSTLYRHKKHECNKNPYQCFYCGKFYRQKYDLKMHVYKKHPDDVTEFEKFYKNLHLFKTPVSKGAVKGLMSGPPQGEGL